MISKATQRRSARLSLGIDAHAPRVEHYGLYQRTQPPSYSSSFPSSSSSSSSSSTSTTTGNAVLSSPMNTRTVAASPPLPRPPTVSALASSPRWEDGRSTKTMHGGSHNDRPWSESSDPALFAWLSEGDAGIARRPLLLLLIHLLLLLVALAFYHAYLARPLSASAAHPIYYPSPSPSSSSSSEKGTAVWSRLEASLASQMSSLDAIHARLDAAERVLGVRDTFEESLAGLKADVRAASARIEGVLAESGLKLAPIEAKLAALEGENKHAPLEARLAALERENK